MSKSLQGGCLCGRVRFTLQEPPLRATHCHCRMCQLAAGAPFVTWAVVRQADFSWTLGEPRLFPSSDLAERGFCAACGTALTFRFLNENNEI
ncbi:MAG TPA: GFA family protein, partial [Rhodospirillales bacterium]|nr:GFA family protein [Rhodospirillales bacterium]